MKKIFLSVAVIIFLANFSFAQSRVRAGFTAGITYSSLTEKINGIKTTGDFRTGPTFGFILDAPMKKNGSFQAGFNFTQKGTKGMSPFVGDTNQVKLLTYYLEVPMNVVFRICPKKSNHFIFGCGVATALCLHAEKTSGKKVVDLKIGTDNTKDYKGIDFGVTGLIGYEIKKNWFFQLNYTQGANTLVPSGQGKDRLLNKYYGLRVGYMISKTKKKKDKK